MVAFLAGPSARHITGQVLTMTRRQIRVLSSATSDRVAFTAEAPWTMASIAAVAPELFNPI